VKGRRIVAIPKKHNPGLWNFDNDRVLGVLATYVLKFDRDSTQLDDVRAFKNIARDGDAKRFPILDRPIACRVAHFELGIACYFLMKVLSSRAFLPLS
jgi:hypothetical protein